MSENFEQMLNATQEVTIKNGEVVDGTVIAVKDNEIVVNIGYKHDGVIAKSEFDCPADADLKELVKVGDPVKAKVLKVNDGEGLVLLSNRPRRERAEIRESEILKNAFENHEVLKATVDEAVSGGITCTVDGTKIFIPASRISDNFERDLTKYQGQEIEFVMIEYNPHKRRVIGDRKGLIVAKKEADLAAVLEKVHEGDVVEGTVKNVTDFGAFIDLGGADGLLHISEMSWGRISNPKRVYKTGDTVKVFVKSIEGSKIALSMKFPEDNPWADAETKYAKGNVVTGKVARLTDFGAFVELAKDVDGLLHVSQITRERVEKPSDVLTQGQEVTVQIIDLDMEHKKISLSMKSLLPKPERPERKPRPERANNRKNENNYTNEEGMVDIEAFLKVNAAAEEQTEE